MKKFLINIPSEDSSYPIFIGEGILGNLKELFDLEEYSKIILITDKNTNKIFGISILDYLPSSASVIEIPIGEKAKNIKTVEDIWRHMLRFGCDRKSLVINLGGGVIGDIGGFAASTYMRGIDFLNIPTTVLAQVDASVGGKTGIDFLGMKNLIGTFSQPVGVVIDTKTLETLPKREFLSGFSEIIKHGLIEDRSYFEMVTSKYPLKFSQKELVDIIHKSCRIKARIVEADNKEEGLRKLLNFGHTIGHAIETLSLETKNPLLHGEAISIGMMAEARISNLLGFISDSELELVNQCLINAGLPVVTKGLEINLIIKKMKSDKKNEKGKINFTLLKSIGEGLFDQNAQEDIVVQALKSITERPM